MSDPDTTTMLIARAGDLTFRVTDRAVPAPQGCVLVPLEHADWDCVGERLAHADPDLAGELPFLLSVILDCVGAVLSPGATVAYVESSALSESSFVARDGAVLDERVVDRTAPEQPAAADRPANVALRHLGVVAGGHHGGESGALGLSLP